jgi:hypothetical protein
MTTQATLSQTTEQIETDEDETFGVFQDEYGFTVTEEVGLMELLNYDTNNSPFEEYLHMIPVPEERRLHIYRTVSEGYPNVRVKTTIEDVRFIANNLVGDHDKVRSFYLTSCEARTLMMALRSYILEQGESLRLTYYEDNGKGMFENRSMGEESLYIRYNAYGNDEREATINSTYTSPTHQIAGFEPLGGEE